MARGAAGAKVCLLGPLRLDHGPWYLDRAGLGGYLMPGAGGTVSQSGRYCIRTLLVSGGARCTVWMGRCDLDGCIIERCKSDGVFLLIDTHFLGCDRPWVSNRQKRHGYIPTLYHIVQGYGNGNETAIVADSDADGVKALAPCQVCAVVVGGGGGGGDAARPEPEPSGESHQWMALTDDGWWVTGSSSSRPGGYHALNGLVSGAFLSGPLKSVPYHLGTLQPYLPTWYSIDALGGWLPLEALPGSPWTISSPNAAVAPAPEAEGVQEVTELDPTIRHFTTKEGTLRQTPRSFFFLMAQACLFALGGLDVDVSDTAATKYPVPIHPSNPSAIHVHHVPGLVWVELRQ
ncbi:hypothetical protein BHE90_002072 [Fusarium euwallaceae]|uniref:Uncharacterized protein n=1 Tax=Fusarium euwallaceae TaxID=1147111 RepID=A0A430M616_9HYPO|nr:hypothetical protein BHE90_002072 [Fusarium euwallaceae]